MAQQPSKTPPASRGPARLKAAAPELLFLHEVAEELRISVNSVRKLIADRELRALKITSVWRVSRFDLQKYLRDARENALSRPEPVRDEALLERDETALAQVLGAAVLDAFDQGRGVYLADRTGCEAEIERYILRVRPDLARSGAGARAFIKVLFERQNEEASVRALGRLHDAAEHDAAAESEDEHPDQPLRPPTAEELGELRELAQEADLPERAWDEGDGGQDAPAH